MISSAEQLVDAAAADPRIASLVERGDWYPIDSHATETADELSDRDEDRVRDVAHPGS